VPSYEQGLATGRREALEHVVAALRRRVAIWRTEETKRGAVRSALLWRFTEQWIARVEGVAAELELQVGQLRTAELSEPVSAGKKDRKRGRR
jgi:hypothetical protein